MPGAPWGHWHGSGPFADYLPFSTSSPHPLDHPPQKQLALKALLLGKQNRDTVFRPFSICCQDEERQSQALLRNFTNPQHNALVHSPYVVIGVFHVPAHFYLCYCQKDLHSCPYTGAPCPHPWFPVSLPRNIFPPTSLPVQILPILHELP